MSMRLFPSLCSSCCGTSSYTLPFLVRSTSKRIFSSPRFLTAPSNGETPIWDDDFLESIKNDSAKREAFKKIVSKVSPAAGAYLEKDLKEVDTDTSVKTLSGGDKSICTEAYLNQIENDEEKLQAFVDAAEKDQQILKRQGRIDERDQVLKLQGEAERLLKQMEKNSSEQPTKQEIRVARTDYALDTPLAHTFDLERLYARADELFKWYDVKSQTEEYMAPYFPVIQSSGMGKTKLLIELQNITDDAVIFLECKYEGIKKNLSKYFTDWFNASLTQNDEDRDRIIKELNGLVEKARAKPSDENRRIIMIFDEASVLLAKNGWNFRVVRWWLRDTVRKNIVAIFAGSTASLANFFSEPPGATTSRDASATYRGGSTLYPPFYDICSIGIFGDACVPEKYVSEYENAIPYGRPLFAVMQRKNNLTDESYMGILTRMLLGYKDYAELSSSWYSILGTRVQLGHVSFDLASNVTSRGYAGLTYFSPKYREIAHNCFFPDPVCARLAMGMMIEGLKIVKESEIVGRKPTFWMKKATELFSDCICRPTKGDIGEVACALYLLFCGDKLRYAIDKELKQFSVPFDKWVSLLLYPNQEVTDVVINQKPIASVSCVQVCRNYLRHSLKDIMPLLPHWYRSGRAMYTYSNNVGFDLIVPVRYRRQAGAELNEDHEDQYDYCPLLVSVKNSVYEAPGKRTNYTQAMVTALKDAGIKTGLCLLFLAGLKKPENIPKEEVDEGIFRFNGDGIYDFTVALDSNDPFGISDFLENASTGGGDCSEIYISHSEAFFTPPANIPVVKSKHLLRETPSSNARAYIEKMREKFEIGKEKGIKYSDE